MKRRSMHLLFGVAALSFAGLVGYQLFNLQRAQRLNAAMTGASAQGITADAPEAQLARAVFAARNQDYDGALTIYKALIQNERADIRRAALYNLGNLHLREAQRRGENNIMQAFPLLELAKHSYRTLLRDDPNDWDGRYNLERALSLAPEIGASLSEDEGTPVRGERAPTTIQAESTELP
jgi:mxaK protein